MLVINRGCPPHHCAMLPSFELCKGERDTEQTHFVNLAEKTKPFLGKSELPPFPKSKRGTLWRLWNPNSDSQLLLRWSTVGAHL